MPPRPRPPPPSLLPSLLLPSSPLLASLLQLLDGSLSGKFQACRREQRGREDVWAAGRLRRWVWAHIRHPCCSS